jgi:hypothetical protein
MLVASIWHPWKWRGTARRMWRDYSRQTFKTLGIHWDDWDVTICDLLLGRNRQNLKSHSWIHLKQRHARAATRSGNRRKKVCCQVA